MVDTDTPDFHLQQHVASLYANQPRQLAFQARSVDQFAAWKRALRAKIGEVLGLSGRTVPSTASAECLQAIDRGDYVEEKHALDVGEGIRAPMYLLIPKAAPPYKAVLAFHGHDPSVQYILGNYPDDQIAQKNRAESGNFAQALAQAGYLVCAVEQRGFGERLSDQFHPPENRNSCRHLSFEYLMQGRTMIGERCWDGMVALTYLQGREDVVKGAIACTGHSGGGTTTLWLSALDERITVLVPSCYFCTFQRSILGMYHCECNYVPGILEYAEIGDLAALIAPRPMRFIAGERDPIFPLEGAKEQFETVQRAYDLLGASDHCSLAVHPGAHGYNFDLSLDWFSRWL
jgi:dienelactone hydrolase